MNAGKRKLKPIFLLLALVFGALVFSVLKLNRTKAGLVEDNKKIMARDTALPTAYFKVEPAYLAKKGGEVSMLATFEGYGGTQQSMNEIAYNWCVDKRPINGIMAGSEDEFYPTTENKYEIKNSYGVLSGGEGVCDVRGIYDPKDWVAWKNDINDTPAKVSGRDRMQAKRIYNLKDPENDKKLEIDGNKLFDEHMKVANTKLWGDLVALGQKFEKEKKDNQKNARIFVDAVQKYWQNRAILSHLGLKSEFRKTLFVTREPAADDDIDEDGLSDSWELKYFGKYAGKKLPVRLPEFPKDFPNFLKEAFEKIVKDNATSIAAINLPDEKNKDKTPQDIYGKFLESVKPEYDVDGDGFFFGDNFGRCLDDYPEMLDKGNAPAEIVKLYNFEACWKSTTGVFWDTFFPGPISEPWQAGVPYAKLSGKGAYDGLEFEMGDGTFTIGEEYVFGTNPVEPDTDNDGVPDEADVTGYNQSSVPLKIQKTDDYTIDVHLYGKTMKGSLAVGPDYAFPKETNNTPYRYWRTDLENQKLKVGGGLNLPTSLIYSPDPVTILNKELVSGQGAGPVKVQAASASEGSYEGSLLYIWYLDGVMLPVQLSEEDAKKEEFKFLSATALKDWRDNTGDQRKYLSGFGRDTLAFGVDFGEEIFKKTHPGKTLSACQSRGVALDVVESGTGRSSHGEINIPIGSVVNFGKPVYVGNVTGENAGLASGVSLDSTESMDQLKDTFLVPRLNLGDDIKKTYKQNPDASQKVEQALSDQNYNLSSFDIDNREIIKGLMGYRLGDVVSVKASLDDTGGCTNAFLKRLNYVWTLDDLRITSKSGVNKRTFETVMSNLPGLTAASSDAANHILKVEVIDPETNNVFARGVKEFRVIQPYIDFEVKGYSKQETPSSANDSPFPKADYQAEPNAKITVTARPKYFRKNTGANGFIYRWRKNGEIVEECDPATGNAKCPVGEEYPSQEVIYPFTKDPGAETEEISLEIETAGSKTGDAVIRENAARKVIVGLARTESTALGGRIAGALFGFVPAYFKNIFNVTFVFGGAVILAILALTLYRGRESKIKS